MLISILVPVRNGLEFLPESIGSVQAQTHQDWELLIGHNGLPKPLLAHEHHRQLVLGDDRITVLELPHCRNKSEAMNAMLAHAQADWIALLDVDDLWMPSKLVAQLSWIDRYDVIGTLAEYFGDRVGPVAIAAGDITPDMLLHTNHLINSSVLLHRRNCYWDPSSDTLGDYDLWLRLARLGRRLANIPQILTRHRIHGYSAFNPYHTASSISAIRRRWFS